jgi:hypothetical protein
MKLKFTILATSILFSNCSIAADTIPELRTTKPYDNHGNPNFGYQGPAGTRYQYDLSKPQDQIRYSVDPGAQIRDSISVDPRRDLDRDLGRYGGGVRR